jgi:MFS family permease
MGLGGIEKMNEAIADLDVPTTRTMAIVVAVAALGYFVDMYDLVLFSVVRVESLRDLGVAPESIMDVGVLLFNCQMAGMLLGGVLWGVLGDKRGRVTTMYGSIAVYSVANLLNAFVTGTPAYAVLRFVAGIGLAGELGAAVTLVAETVPQTKRGYGTSIVASVGILGALPAASITHYSSWRIAYVVGGILGIVLLVSRLKLNESGIFRLASAGRVASGDVAAFFKDRDRAWRYIRCVAVGVPLWFALGVLTAFAPEITKELGVSAPVAVGTAVIYQFTGAALGNIVAGALSQWFRHRIKVIGIFTGLTAATSLLFLFSYGVTPSFFYGLFFLLGLVTGHWGVFATTAAEQFGTNLRATAASSIPNVVRASVIPMTLAIQTMSPHLGLRESVLGIGFVVIAVALASLRKMKDTFDRDLAFIEPY